MKITIEPLGDSAAIIAFSMLGDAAASRAVHAGVEQLNRRRINGILEVTPAFASLTVFYDPSLLRWDDVATWLASVEFEESESTNTTSRVIEIPVCYDAEFAPDLESIAAVHSLRPRDVIHLHCSVVYRVQMIGFSPGFPYMSGLPSTLHTPRRPSPRLRVPVGSVAIGGNQTGIYTLESPGGWNIVGRTPESLFDPIRDPPCKLQASDCVRFVAIDRNEFHALRGRK